MEERREGTWGGGGEDGWESKLRREGGRERRGEKVAARGKNDNVKQKLEEGRCKNEGKGGNGEKEICNG